MIVATIKPGYLSTPHPLMIFCTRIWEADQIFAHAENKSADMESAMTFKQGVSGNPHGNRHRTRHLLNQEFMQALLLHFRQHGKKAIEKVARNQPAAYLKILALLVPREMKLEHSGGVKASATRRSSRPSRPSRPCSRREPVRRRKSLKARRSLPRSRLPNGPSPEAALEATLEPTKRKPSRLMMEVDTAIGPQERKPRKRVPSPVDA